MEPVYVGIDFGSHSIYITTTRGSTGNQCCSQMASVMNCFQQDRKILSVMGVYKDIVYACDGSMMNYKLTPQNFVLFVRNYLGRRPSEIQSGYGYDMLQQIEEGENGSTCFIFSPNGKDKEIVSSETAAAYVFAELFTLIQSRYASFDGRHVVVSIPTVWRTDQIQTLKTIMTEVGFKDPQFLFDIEAIAYQYNYYNLIHNRLTTTRRVLFVDVGYSHCSVFCAEYNRSRVSFPFCCYSESCCGRLFDRILTELVEEKLQPDEVREIRGRPQVMAAIRSSCEKSKYILSSEGVEDISIFVPGWSKRKEQMVEITKDDWDRRCQRYGVFHVLEMMCRDCLRTMKHVDGAVLEGSSAHFSEIRKMVDRLLQLEGQNNGALELTSNLEEDVSRGCCIRSFCNANPGEPRFVSQLPRNVRRVEVDQIPMCRGVNEVQDADARVSTVLKEEMGYLNRMKEVPERIASIRKQTESVIDECQQLLKASSMSSLQTEFGSYIKDLRTTLDVGKQSIIEEAKYNYLLDLARSLLEQIKDQTERSSVAILDCYR